MVSAVGFISVEFCQNDIQEDHNFVNVQVSCRVQPGSIRCVAGMAGSKLG